jgi:hypothetical protein
VAQNAREDSVDPGLRALQKWFGVWLAVLGALKRKKTF